MEKLFKKFLYTSVGFASLAKEKMTTLIEDLIKDGKLSEEEGKKIMDDFKKNTDEQRTDFDKKMKDVVDNTVQNLKFVKQKEVEKLRNRIDILEKLIKQDKDKKKKTKKTTTKKKKTTKKTKDKKPDNDKK